MPIRLKSEHRPKYRMIHVCDHEDGCFLMAQNMQKRKDELFFNVRQNVQLTLFDISPDYASSVEENYITKDEVAAKVHSSLLETSVDIHITKFLASFVNSNGLICDFQMIYDILDEMKAKGELEIIREPVQTPTTGKESRFWEEKGEKKVILRRLHI